MPGYLKTYMSMDSISSKDTEEFANFPTEFPLSIWNTTPRVKTHVLKLKIRAIVTLIPDRLCVIEQGCL